MFRKLPVSMVLGALLLAACAGAGAPGEDMSPTTTPPDSPVTQPTGPDGEEPTPPPWEPVPGDEALHRGPVYFDERELLVLESFPPQFVLRLAGSLPTPCHQLRAFVPEPDDRNRIRVEVYSLVEPEKICIQVLEPFEANVPLGSYASGSYTVFVNGEQVGKVEP